MIDWPPKSSFEPPRYPNAWLYVSDAIAPTYLEAIAFILECLQRYVGVGETPTRSLECADGQGRVHHLQPVTGLPDPARDHYHDLHIRYYFSHLPPRHQHRATIEVNGQTHTCWRLPTSVHYEPEPEHPGHPYIDECPICGVVSPYDRPGDRCEMSHDPLGLELLFYGTIRGEIVTQADGRPVGGLQTLAADYEVHLSIQEPPAPEMNTLHLGTAVILPRRK